MKLRIIHLEDNPLDADLIQARLQDAGIDCTVVRTADRESFEAALAEPADLILADYALPQYTGTEALELAQRLQPRTPFIFVTGALGEERAIELLKAGAIDYILKERLGRLIPAVARALRETRQQLEQELAQREIEQRARELEDLYQLSEAVAHAADIDAIYEIALNSLTSTLGVDRASILLYDDDGVIRFKAWRGLSDTYRAAAEGHSAWDRDTRDPHPIMVPDVAKDPGLESLRDRILSEGIRALAFIPLTTEGRLCGKFMLYRDQPHDWPADEIRRAQNIANHVAFALQNRRAQQALKDSEERFRVMAQTVPNIIFVAGPDGQLEYINRRFVEYTGLDLEQARGSGWMSVLHPEDLQGAREILDESIRTGQPYEVTFRVRAADGQFRWFMLRATAIRDSEDRVVNWFGAATDIDALIQTEQNLAYHAAQLARSNADLEDFAYVASHDLKEPLRGISNFANFVLEDYRHLLPEDGQDKLHTLVRLSQRMYRLLDHLLEYSRVGRAEFALQDAPLEDIIRSALDSLGPTLQNENVDITVRSPLPTLYCDPVRISQVISNLIVNAIKYNENEIKRVEVGALPGDAAPIVYIKDNGIGIPERHQEQIFKMFKRLHARDRYGGGSGAGLAIVKKIIQRHGGRIWVDSTPGQGTTFYFTLAPAKPAHSSALTVRTRPTVMEMSEIPP